MITVVFAAAAFLAFQGQEVCSAAIGDIARNVQSDLILLDAGLNPQSRTSKKLNLDVPAGTFLIHNKSTVVSATKTSANREK